MMRTIRRVVAPALAACALLAPGLAAREPGPEAAKREAHSAMTQLRSPVTPFHTLDMCPDPAAAALRDTVLVMAAQGMSAGEIVEEVVERRGEELRLVPKRSGVGLWAWIAPPAVLLLGLGLLWGKLQGLRGRQEPSAAAREEIALSDEDRALLDASLAEWESSPEEAR